MGRDKQGGSPTLPQHGVHSLTTGTLHTLPLLPSGPPYALSAARCYGAVPSRLLVAVPNEKECQSRGNPAPPSRGMALPLVLGEGRRAKGEGQKGEGRGRRALGGCCSQFPFSRTVLTALCYTHSTYLLNSCSPVLPGEGLRLFPAGSVPISVAGGSTQLLQHMRALEVRRAYSITSYLFTLFAGSTGSEGSSGPGLPAARRLAPRWLRAEG